jgi:hypothetical protein
VGQLASVCRGGFEQAGWFRAGTAGDCRADLILDAVNPPVVMNNGKTSVTTGEAKASVWFRPLQEYAAWTRL